MNLKKRIERAKDATIKRPYIYSFVPFMLVYLGLNYYINKAYVLGLDFLKFNPLIVVPFMTLNFLVAALFALNLNLFVIRFRNVRSLQASSSGASAIGVFAGVLGGVCPGCFAGLFPTVLGIFGITATLTVLPFFGVELLVGSALLMLVGSYMLTNDNTCKVDMDDTQNVKETDSN